MTEYTLSDLQQKKMREMFAGTGTATKAEDGTITIVVASKRMSDGIPASNKMRNQLSTLFDGSRAEITKIENQVIIVITPKTLSLLNQSIMENKAPSQILAKREIAKQETTETSSV